MKRLLAATLLGACTTTPTGSGPDAPDTERVTVIAPYTDASNAITPGATVLFYDDTGALLDRATTGGDGKARSIAGPVASVLVVPPPNVAGDYYSWVGVWPGDHLTTQATATPAAADPGHHLTVTIPRFASDATDYAVSAVGMVASTTATPGTDPLTLDAAVAPDAPQVGDLVAQVTTGNAKHFIVAHGVAFGAGTVDLRGSHWDSGAPFGATIALPAGATWLTAYDERLANGLVLWEDAMRADAPASDVALQFTSPQAGTAAGLAVNYQLADGTTYALSYNDPPDGLNTATVMPLATDIARSGDVVTWNSSLTTPQEVGVELVLYGASTNWHVVMPPGERSFTMPQIPIDLVQPPAMSNPRVTFVAGNEPGAYAALRTAEQVFDLPRWAQVMPRIRGTFRFAGI